MYRGGVSQKLIYPKPYEVNLETENTKTLEIRFQTNRYGERQSAFLVEIGPQYYSVLLEHIARHIAADSPLSATILKAVAAELDRHRLESELAKG